MLTINSIQPNYNSYTSFHGGASKKVVGDALSKVAPFMGVFATGALAGDVFVKTAKSNNAESQQYVKEYNFKENLKSVPQAKAIVEKMNKKYNIKGETYKELAYHVKVAASDFRIDARDDEECGEYDVAEKNMHHADEMEYYYNFLEDLASEKYSPEEAKEYNDKIKEYKAIRNKMESILKKNDYDDSDPEYMDYELKADDLATSYFAFKIYNPEFFMFI